MSVEKTNFANRHWQVIMPQVRNQLNIKKECMDFEVLENRFTGDLNCPLADNFGYFKIVDVHRRCDIPKRSPTECFVLEKYALNGLLELSANKYGT